MRMRTWQHVIQSCRHTTRDDHEQLEAFRFKFTIANNPGLIEDTSNYIGLGHLFLQSKECSQELVYVMDLSGPSLWDELCTLQEELEKYKHGVRKQARMVIADKVDLLASDGDLEDVRMACAKLAQLEHFKREVMDYYDGQVHDVVLTSGKYSQNLRSVV